MTGVKGQLRVLKKLSPNQPGAVKLTERYGDALVCVRHRTDTSGKFRYTTVELLVETTPVRSPMRRTVQIKIGLLEGQVRSAACLAGATWDTQTELWTISYQAAKVLNLLDRVVEI